MRNTFSAGTAIGIVVLLVAMVFGHLAIQRALATYRARHATPIPRTYSDPPVMVSHTAPPAIHGIASPQPANRPVAAPTPVLPSEPPQSASEPRQIQ